MTVIDSRQRNGSLTLGGVNFACQQRTVTINPPDQGNDAPDEVLCGDALADEDDAKWTLALTAVQDFEDEDGFVNYTWLHQGQKVAFIWKPQGATGPTYAGTVTVWPVSVGGEVRKRLESEAEWFIDSKPTRTEAA